MSAQPDLREFPFGERDFRRVCTMIRARAGIALTPSKRDMVYSRLARRLRTLGIASFTDYLDALDGDAQSEEWQAFTNALTTNLTAFFREPHHFDLLADLLRAHRGGGRIAIWCSAASTGEEPYSIAITACETFGTLTPPVRILATDIDTTVLERAASGVYAMERVEQMPPERLRRFFQRGSGPNEGLCRVAPALRALIEFRPLNLLDANYDVEGPFAAIFCRNVMIYFDKATQYEVLARMKPLLTAEGRFFAGHSESFFHATDLFQSCGRTVYRHAAAASRRGTA